MTRSSVFHLLAITLLALCAAGVVQAAPTYCNSECTFSSCRTQACTDPETGSIITCQQWGTYNYNDYDCDNVPNTPDNCPYVFNSGQEDCDGDGTGNVCDSENGVFYQSSPITICHIESEGQYLPWPRMFLDVWVEALHEDVSACNSPDKWVTVVAETSSCSAGFSWPPQIPSIPSAIACCESKYNLTTCLEYLDDDQCHN